MEEIPVAHNCWGGSQICHFTTLRILGANYCFQDEIYSKLLTRSSFVLFLTVFFIIFLTYSVKTSYSRRQFDPITKNAAK